VRFDTTLDVDLIHGRRINYEVIPAVTISEFDRDTEGLTAAIRLNAVVEFAHPADESAEESDQTGPGPVPFEIELALHGTFSWDSAEMPDDDLARGWLEYNGMYLMWPYLRSYVAIITGMSHLPSLTIYTMNVPKPPVITSAEPDAEVSPESDVDTPLRTE
jgi:hypothetical protein